jgi:hypothetical protein
MTDVGEHVSFTLTTIPKAQNAYSFARLYNIEDDIHNNNNSVALAREQTIPTELT